jgi:hypothetical protein
MYQRMQVLCGEDLKVKGKGELIERREQQDQGAQGAQGAQKQQLFIEQQKRNTSRPRTQQ